MKAESRISWISFFVFMGSTVSLVPAVIPFFANAMSVDVFVLLNAVPLMFAGLFLGVLIAPLVGNRIEFRFLVRIAGILMLLGIISATVIFSVESFFIGSLLIGFGFGVSEVTITAQVRKEIEKPATMMTKLNAGFALAAMAAPVFLVLELITIGSWWVFGIIGAGLVFSSISVQQTSELKREVSSGSKKKAPAALFLLMVGIYVGAESVLAGWSAVSFDQVANLDSQFAPLASSAFWGLIAAGRLISIRIDRNSNASNSLVVWSSISAASLILAVVLFGAGSELLLIGFAAAIFAAGPIYGQILAIALNTKTASEASRATMMLIVSGAAGGFLLPALVQIRPSVEFALLLSGVAMAIVAISSLLAKSITTPKGIKVVQ